MEKGRYMYRRYTSVSVWPKKRKTIFFTMYMTYITRLPIPKSRWWHKRGCDSTRKCHWPMWQVFSRMKITKIAKTHRNTEKTFRLAKSSRKTETKGKHRRACLREKLLIKNNREERPAPPPWRVSDHTQAQARRRALWAARAGVPGERAEGRNWVPYSWSLWVVTMNTFQSHRDKKGSS